MDLKDITREKVENYTKGELVELTVYLSKQVREFTEEYSHLGNAIIRLDEATEKTFKVIRDLLKVTRGDVKKIQDNLHLTVEQLGPMYAEWVAKKEQDHFERRGGKKVERMQ